MKVLYVSGAAKIRGRTAEVLTILGGHDARCCGVNPGALVLLSEVLLAWADVVVCMEQAHASEVLGFLASKDKDVLVLGLNGVFRPFEAALVAALCKGFSQAGQPGLAAAVSRGVKNTAFAGFV